MVPFLINSSKKSILFNLIGAMLNINDKASGIVQQGFIIVIGTDLNAKFGLIIGLVGVA